MSLADDTYYIGTAQELWDVMQDSSILNDENVKIELTANINLNDLGDVDGNGSNWIAVGNSSSNTFKGTFDGKGYTISNLKINSDSDFQGFFGYNDNATIQNVHLENANVTGGMNVGGLIGYENGTVSVSNCSVSGNVIGNESSAYVGGLAGYAVNVTFSDCNSTANVTGGMNVGGLVGVNNSGTINNCYTTGDITAGGYVGGLAGSAHTISNSHATGNVTGSTMSNVGGLAGGAHTISNSYATGNVTGASILVGGLTGTSSSGTSIENSYATGNVTGASMVGGLTGYNFGTISNSFATGNVTGNSDAGGLVGTSSGTVTNSYFTSSSPDNGAGEAKEESWFTPENIATTMGITVHAGFMGNLTFQIGTDGSSLSKIEVDTMLDLGSLNFDVSTESSARNAITKCDELLEKLNKKSADIGVNVNILNSIYEGNSLTQINLTSSNSRIVDADIAKESSNLVKAQILQSATSSLLSQTQSLSGSLLLGLLRM